MSFTRWLRNLQSFCRQGTTTRKSRRAACSRTAKRARLHLEALEDRCLPSFTMPVEYGADLAAQSLVSGDFNGDGRIDLATANTNDHTISMLIGNGDGTFQAARTSAAGNYPQSLVAGDLNGDGKDDLLMIDINTSNLSLLLSNGDGTFQTPRIVSLPAQTPPDYTGLPLEQGTISVAVGDFNSDSKLDVVAGGQTMWFVTGDEYMESYVDNYVNILLGNGDGTFLPASVEYLSGGYPNLHPGDFNNDGRLDVVLDGGALLGNGDGTLQEFVPSVVYVDGVSNPQGDFNGDGNLDVLTDHAQTGPALHLGNGDGTFQQGVYLDVTGGVWHSAAVGDVNVDGNLDIVLVRSEVENFGETNPVTTHTTRVLLGNGNGSFTAVSSDLSSAVPGMWSFNSAVLADFDSDGSPDLAATRYELSDVNEPVYVYGGVHVALNNGAWALPPLPPPSISLSDSSVTEGNSGTRTATFTVTLSAAYSQPVTVGFSTANGTATADSDYQALNGILTFASGETSKTISILVNGDRVGESNETFLVTLGNATNATIADGTGQGTIVDDEPRISINDVSKKEGNSGTTVFTFTVTLSAAYDVPVTINFATANGTAKTSDNDYVANSGTITFAPGETTKTITVVAKGDKKKEANENFFVDLSDLSSYAVFLDSRGQGTIQNDD